MDMSSRRKRYMHKVSVFRERHPYVGPVFWILSIQYFIVQAVVGAAWSMPYSLLRNTISDLGNTACGVFYDRYVCSPLHGLMNSSFIVVGITIVFGSALIAHDFRKNRFSRLGFWGMSLAGFGTIIVGLFPENTILAFHTAGAFLPFLFGNVALVLFGFSSDLPFIFRYYTRFSGLIALAGLILFLSDQYLGLDQGGMERVVAYPQTVWLILFGWYVSMSHYRQRRGKKIIYS